MQAGHESLPDVDLVSVEQRVKQIYSPDAVPAHLDFFEELIYRIVRFRRGHAGTEDREIFKALVTDNAHRLNELNGRWLVSVADTFADFPGDRYAKGVALLPAFIHFIEQVHSARYRGAGEGYATINKIPDHNTFAHLYSRISGCPDITGLVTRLLIKKVSCDTDSLLGEYLASQRLELTN